MRQMEKEKRLIKFNLFSLYANSLREINSMRIFSNKKKS